MRTSLRTLGLCVALALASGVAASQVPTCSGSGLSVIGGRLGDPWSVNVTGPPNAAGVLASDTSGGPVATPFGGVCLGLTPALVMMPFTLDATGNFAMSGVLPVAPLFPAGSTLFTQVALAHPSLPGGYSITNGFAVTIRSPALFVFRTGFVPTLDRIDAATDTITMSAPIPGWQGGPALRVPRLGWIAFRIGTAVAFIDDLTGAVVLMIPGAWDAYSDPTRSLAVSEDGSQLYVSSFASTWTGTGFSLVMTLRTFSLPSGALMGTPVVMPFAGTVNRGIYAVPSTPIVYVAANDRLYVLDVTAGLLVNTITFPAPLSGGRQFAFVSPGRIWVVVAGSLIGIDTTTHAQVAGPTVLGSVVVPVAIGPGPGGLALWALDNFGLGGSAVLQVPLTTLAPQSVGALTEFPISPYGAPSAGGTGMLILADVNQGTVWDVTLATGTIAPVASATVAFEVLRSGTLTKTYSYGSTGLVSTQTDPTVGPGTVIPLPNTSLAQVLLVSN